MRHLSITAVALALVLATAACSTSRQTFPDDTATEQLLLSRAVDEAVAQLSLPFEAGTSAFLDTAGVEGPFAKYATAAVRERLLELGANVAADRGEAEVVVEVRSGALSIDEHSMLIGIPSFDIPIPLAGAATVPELALYKRAERRGIAKLAATAYTADNGEHVDSTKSRYGFSHKRKWTVLLVASWSKDNLIPKDVEPSTSAIEAPD